MCLVQTEGKSPESKDGMRQGYVQNHGAGKQATHVTINKVVFGCGHAQCRELTHAEVNRVHSNSRTS